MKYLIRLGDRVASHDSNSILFNYVLIPIKLSIMCTQEMSENAVECGKFADYYRVQLN
jgi:hypothetical protein